MASFLRRTFSRLTLSRARAQHSGVQEDSKEAADSDWVLLVLWKVYRRAEDAASDSFTRGEMSLWNVEITSFDPLDSRKPDKTSCLDPAAYFVPLPMDVHEKHPRIVDKETEDHLNLYQKTLAPNYSPYRNGILRDPEGRATSLAARFRYEMSISRKDLDPEYGDTTLRFATKWRSETNFHIDGFPDREVRSGRGLYAANDIFVNSKHPHVKVILSNAVRPEKDDDLLRSELLVILAAMHSRLRVESFLDHVIMPVMVFSFMPPSHVRVLMAIFDGQKIRISMSGLMPCSATSQDLYDTLVRYLAGGTNPKVDTKKFPVHPVARHMEEL
ncbi:hypothetical protein BO86DRAFT_454136 [Aspergillus japonicus CBS 114.51]|uniref:Uncharacterized protein n=1 Tax=Aspergillus japonicus CBS 114.51 TaxID=1448312 RepID=A0A8T8XAN7_ASPJA|nr:hypothetical protein BO86DRAFT_454136 [Aspergillus japonicus CBS 114.51]RAH84552.1 hypothetical protein BO86DRAFT_454136 [Aspergillus japonicus CBS 114.51]